MFLDEFSRFARSDSRNATTVKRSSVVSNLARFVRRDLRLFAFLTSFANLFFSSCARFWAASKLSMCVVTCRALVSPEAAKATMPPPPLLLEPASEGEGVGVPAEAEGDAGERALAAARLGGMVQVRSS